MGTAVYGSVFYGGTGLALQDVAVSLAMSISGRPEA